jgi:hypothetical protein
MQANSWLPNWLGVWWNILSSVGVFHREDFPISSTYIFLIRKLLYLYKRLFMVVLGTMHPLLSKIYKSIYLKCREYGTLLACDPQCSTFKLSVVTWVSKNYQNSNPQICSARHRWKINGFLLPLLVSSNFLVIVL